MTAFEAQVHVAPKPALAHAIAITKTLVVTETGKETGIFKMTLGGETIDLLPLRDWSQLDVYKWRARGKLPGTPAGLEITHDHVKVAGETVLLNDPEGSAKLQRLLNDWLILERGTFELAQKRSQAKQVFVEHEAPPRPEDLVPRFQVQVDKEGQVHINCLQGKEMLATIGLNPAGFNSLFNQGLLHKPHSLKVGALHDWVELDGQLFSFERGNNDASKLEKVLNERYLSVAALGQGKDVVVFTNAASSTGFDIQFPAKVAGTYDNRRRPLNEDTLALLQDPDRCGLLSKDLVIKLSRPNLIFKRKTPDGGERYLKVRPENLVTVIGDEGEVRVIDLSKPVNYLRLSAVEFTAVFNHPAINQHGKASTQPTRADVPPLQSPVSVAHAVAPPPTLPPMTASPSTVETKPVAVPAPPAEASQPKEPPKRITLKLVAPVPAAQPAPAIRPLPNLWLQRILDQPSVPQDWFACLVYSKMAEYFRNSFEGYFGPIPCWACSLGKVDDLADPSFRGILLTQKGGLGYINQGHLARFRNEIAFVGTLESTIEAIGVNLVAVGTDSQQRIVFIVSEGYRTKFGIPEPTVIRELARLKEHGALVMSVNEVLQSSEPLEVIWTVPAEQENPEEPQALESLRPGSAGG